MIRKVFFENSTGVKLCGSLSFAGSSMAGDQNAVLLCHGFTTSKDSLTSRLFATYNMGIPDQFRVEMFLKEFKDRWLGDEDSLPPVVVIYLPNDHGDRERPADGYPFRESFIADNDLALGRVIDFLSHSRYWQDMAIFVTEDDPQGGVDHVDAHRSLLMVISPYAWRNHVGHVHYSFGSIMKTFWHILGIPFLNQYDAGATDLADLFTSEPDRTPYVFRPVDPRIFDPEKVLDPFDEGFNWDALRESPVLDDPEVMQEWMREEIKKKQPSGSRSPSYPSPPSVIGQKPGGRLILPWPSPGV